MTDKPWAYPGSQAYTKQLEEENTKLKRLVAAQKAWYHRPNYTPFTNYQAWEINQIVLATELNEAEDAFK